jgi:hypothetical protein
MKKLLLALALSGSLAPALKADMLVVVTNGGGIYYPAYSGMAFTDANGNYVFIGGTQDFVEIFYKDGSILRFPYDSANRTFSGRDTKGAFTAAVHETLATIHRGGGGGRGDGYPGIRTVVSSGVIYYLYQTPEPRFPPPTNEW